MFHTTEKHLRKKYASISTSPFVSSTHARLANTRYAHMCSLKNELSFFSFFARNLAILLPPPYFPFIFSLRCRRPHPPARMFIIATDNVGCLRDFKLCIRAHRIRHRSLTPAEAQTPTFRFSFLKSRPTMAGKDAPKSDAAQKPVSSTNTLSAPHV